MIKIHEEFTMKMAKKVCSSMKHLFHQGKQEIWLSIDSPGGDVGAYFMILQTIVDLRQRGVKINTYNKREASSAGAFLLMIGDRRVVHPGSTTMIHQTQLSVRHLPLKIVKDFIKKCDEDNDIIINLTAEVTGKSFEEIKTILSYGDTYFNSIEAVDFGLADDIKRM